MYEAHMLPRCRHRPPCLCSEEPAGHRARHSSYAALQRQGPICTYVSLDDIDGVEGYFYSKMCVLAKLTCAWYAADPDAWSTVAEEPFVEASKSPALWRALYIPVFSAQRVHWTHQVLLSSITLGDSNKEAYKQQ